VSKISVACHLLSSWFLAQSIFWLWRWRRYVPPKRRLTLKGLQAVISQNHRCKNLKFFSHHLLVSLFIILLYFFLFLFSSSHLLFCYYSFNLFILSTPPFLCSVFSPPAILSSSFSILTCAMCVQDLKGLTQGLKICAVTDLRKIRQFCSDWTKMYGAHM
jgi:hypothetical protein